MANGDVLESYGVCDECKNSIDRPEEVTYLFDKPVHTKCYPNEGEIQRRLNSNTSKVSLRSGGVASPSRYP
jgi:hypothetical protein